MAPAGQPIVPLIRVEEPPQDAVVVIRGGPIAAAKLVEQPRRQQAVFTDRGEPMVAVSVDLTIEGWTIERVLLERMWSTSRYATTRVGRLRRAGYELVATGASPHCSVLLLEATEQAADDFLSHFGPTLDNVQAAQEMTVPSRSIEIDAESEKTRG